MALRTCCTGTDGERIHSSRATWSLSMAFGRRTVRPRQVPDWSSCLTAAKCSQVPRTMADRAPKPLAEVQNEKSIYRLIRGGAWILVFCACVRRRPVLDFKERVYRGDPRLYRSLAGALHARPHQGLRSRTSVHSLRDGEV